MGGLALSHPHISRRNYSAGIFRLVVTALSDREAGTNREHVLVCLRDVHQLLDICWGDELVEFEEDINSTAYR